jgi:hypothetical protein
MAERVELDLLPATIVRRRARGVMLMALVLAAAVGGVVGLFGGRVPGLIAAGLVGLPLLLLALGEARRRTWLEKSVVTVRALGWRRVNIAKAQRRDLMVSDVRGQRTVSLLLSASRGPTVTVPLAIYTPVGGVELGVLGLRRLADALAGADTADTAGAADTADHTAKLLSTLLIAQLRSEARGDSPAERPLRLAAGLAPAGRLVRKVNHGRLAALVSELG